VVWAIALTAVPAESHRPGTAPGMMPDPLLEKHRQQERERKRRFRSRRQVMRAGGVIVRELPVGGATLWDLQRLGLLDKDSRHDPEAVATALRYLVENTVHELANIVGRLAPADDEVPDGT
jgi:hypothetical protein